MSGAPALCRDCGWAAANAAALSRCPQCGSPRVVRHAELFDLTIAHLDCDAFFAAVEKHDNPSLRARPVIIGGGKRGVVSTACYQARISGVRSAMPMYKARKLCPQAVVVKPNMKRYAQVSAEIRERMRALTPLVEPLSVDEAFLDLQGTALLHKQSPAQSMARLAQEIETEIGVSVSIGLAPNKFLAKVASELDKPRGFCVIGAQEAAAFLATRPVSTIWGVGAVTARRLERDGYKLLGDLQEADLEHLKRRYGAWGARLYGLSWGKDVRKVSKREGAKSVSAENTFFTDISSFQELRRKAWRACERVSARLKAKGLAGRTVTLKLKTAQFKSLTRRITTPEPVYLAEDLFRAIEPLLAKETQDEIPYRLIGVGVSGLQTPLEQPAHRDLFGGAPEGDNGAVERTIDAVRGRFGEQAISKGRGFKTGGPGVKKRPDGVKD